MECYDWNFWRCWQGPFWSSTLFYCGESLSGDSLYVCCLLFDGLFLPKNITAEFTSCMFFWVIALLWYVFICEIFWWFWRIGWVTKVIFITSFLCMLFHGNDVKCDNWCLVLAGRMCCVIIGSVNCFRWSSSIYLCDWLICRLWAVLIIIWCCV